MPTLSRMKAIRVQGTYSISLGIRAGLREEAGTAQSSRGICNVRECPLGLLLPFFLSSLQASPRLYSASAPAGDKVQEE